MPCGNIHLKLDKFISLFPPIQERTRVDKQSRRMVALRAFPGCGKCRDVHANDEDVWMLLSRCCSNAKTDEKISDVCDTVSGGQATGREELIRKYRVYYRVLAASLHPQKLHLQSHRTTALKQINKQKQNVYSVQCRLSKPCVQQKDHSNSVYTISSELQAVFLSLAPSCTSLSLIFNITVS